MKFRTFIQKLVEQKNTSPRLGALMNAYASTGILYSPLTLIGVATTLYGLWGKAMLAKYIPWMTFPIILACMVGFILIMMIFFYKVVIPSQVSFAMLQNYKHRNPMVDDLQEILKQLKNISERLDKLEQKN